MVFLRRLSPAKFSYIFGISLILPPAARILRTMCNAVIQCLVCVFCLAQVGSVCQGAVLYFTALLQMLKYWPKFSHLHFRKRRNWSGRWTTRLWPPSKVRTSKPSRNSGPTGASPNATTEEENISSQTPPNSKSTSRAMTLSLLGAFGPWALGKNLALKLKQYLQIS